MWSNVKRLFLENRKLTYNIQKSQYSIINNYRASFLSLASEVRCNRRAVDAAACTRSVDTAVSRSGAVVARTAEELFLADGGTSALCDQCKDPAAAGHYARAAGAVAGAALGCSSVASVANRDLHRVDRATAVAAWKSVARANVAHRPEKQLFRNKL